MARKAPLNVTVDAETLKIFRRLNQRYEKRFGERVNLSESVRHLLVSLVLTMKDILNNPEDKRIDERDIFIGYRHPVDTVKKLIELYKDQLQELEGGEKTKTA